MGADVGFHVRVFDSILLTVFIIDPVVGYLFARVRGPHGTMRYVQKFLPLGIISALGLIVISPDSPFRLLALVKLIESTAFVSAWRHQLLHRGNAIRLFLFVYWMAVLIHLVACGWYELRTATHIPSEHAYLESVYWAVTTLATIGYGDITPSSPAQMQYAIAVMLLGFVMMGYLVGNIAGVLNKHDPLRAQYTSALDEVSAFAAYHGLPTNLKHQIIDYYWYMWQQGAAFSTSVVLDNLPSGIRSEIMLYLKRDVLSRVPFFKEASETFLREIATVMEPVVVTPGEFVFHIGDPATHMFFVSRGTLDVLDGTGSAIGKLSSGDFLVRWHCSNKRVGWPVLRH